MKGVESEQMNVGNNIKKLRKKAELTQEQLADILGVTIGAVSKWENYNSVPDLLLIMEMAKLFRVSVDTLIGFDSAQRDIDEICAEIEKMKHEKRFSEAIQCARYALVQYPNDFNILYTVGQLYRKKGLVENNSEDKKFAKKILENSLKYIYQNKDISISEVVIKHDIASVTEDIQESISILTQINARGFFDDDLSILYAEADNIEKAIDLGNTYINSSIDNAIAMGINLVGFNLVKNEQLKAEYLCEMLDVIVGVLNNEESNSKKVFYKNLISFLKMIIKIKLGDLEEYEKIRNQLLNNKFSLIDEKNEGFVVGEEVQGEIYKKNVNYFVEKKVLSKCEAKKIMEDFCI